jgi:predicted Ser/Thr protein kinase
MCLHLNNMATDEIDALGRFVKDNASRFIDFDQASRQVWPRVVTKPMEVMLRMALMAKRRLR